MFHQYFNSCERVRHLDRTDVFNDVRFKLLYKRQIYRFHKQINKNRLPSFFPVVKVLTASIGFPGNKKNKVESIVKDKKKETVSNPTSRIIRYVRSKYIISYVTTLDVAISLRSTPIQMGGDRQQSLNVYFINNWRKNMEHPWFPMSKNKKRLKTKEACFISTSTAANE